MRIKTEKHIAEIDPWEYFLPVLNSEKDAKIFVKKARGNRNSRIIVHQCARMLYLADKIHQQGRPAFDVLFFIIIAEAAAKIKFNYTGERDSKKYVYKFFENILNEEEKDKLEKSFIKYPSEKLQKDAYLSLKEVVALLYKVRCDIVHRGVYFDIIFFNDNPDDDNIIFQWKIKQSVSPKISTNDLRKIILKGVIRACEIEN
ncbi:MAG: hypothetical protein K8S27_01070 [Candidatus Omnitrophica bacterium]|nr:hypothetical protein [Candidatus Omnitrophota bacterium]